MAATREASRDHRGRAGTTALGAAGAAAPAPCPRGGTDRAPLRGQLRPLARAPWRLVRRIRAPAVSLPFGPGALAATLATGPHGPAAPRTPGAGRRPRSAAGHPLRVLADGAARVSRGATRSLPRA